jgi:hypothetical protein
MCLAHGPNVIAKNNEPGTHRDPYLREILYPAQCGASCPRRTPALGTRVGWARPVSQVGHLPRWSPM